MTVSTEEKFTVKSSIRHGLSWADQQDSPGWAAKSSPKFDEEMPEIELEEQEYDLKNSDRTTSTASSNLIPVYIGGLDYGLEAKDLEDFFASKSIRVNRVRVPKSNGKPKGCAFLNVYDQGALAAILKLNGTLVSGRAITVREDNGPVKLPRSTSAASSKTGGRWREEKKSAAPEEPKERKKLELKPRSKQEDSDLKSTTSSGIFGGAKPRDEFEYQKRKTEETKKTSKQRPSKPTVVAPVVTAAPVPVKKAVVSKNRFSALGGDDDSCSSE